MPRQNFRLIDFYFVTDSGLTRNSVIDDVRAAVKAGVKIVQYREKSKSTKEMVEEASRIKEICRNKAIFLVNDRIDVALAVDADGVHLGQDDMPYRTARKILGDRIIGLTVHDIQEAAESEKLGADYVGASPIFTTKTKLDAGKAAGLRLLRGIKKHTNLPVVAIGGIDLENAGSVIRAGADSAVAISAVVTKDVEVECRKFIRKIQESKQD